MTAASVRTQGDDETRSIAGANARDALERQPQLRGGMGFRKAALNALQREASRPGEEAVAGRSRIGTGAVLSGTSLGSFGPTHPTRVRVFAFLHRESTELALMCLVFAHTVVLALAASSHGASRGDAETMEGRGDSGHVADDGSDDDASRCALAAAAPGTSSSSRWSTWEMADVAILTVYAAEMCLRIFALGFVRGKHAYLRNAYNRLDAAVVVVSVTIVVAARGTGSRLITRTSLGQFRLFRAVLALRRLPSAAAVAAIVEALSRSVETLADLGGVALVCAAFYALMGMSVFGGSLRRRCVLTDSADTSGAFYYALGGTPDRELFCGDAANDPHGRGFVCPGVSSVDAATDGLWGVTGVARNESAYDPDSDGDGGNVTGASATGGRVSNDALRIPSSAALYCSGLPGNPRFGKQSFDDFGSALLTMFTCITMEDWDQVMYAVMNSEYKVAGAYFVTLIIVGTYFIVSVFVAGTSGVFLRLRKDNELLLAREREARRRKALGNAIKLFTDGDAGGEEDSTRHQPTSTESSSSLHMSMTSVSSNIDDRVRKRRKKKQRQRFLRQTFADVVKAALESSRRMKAKMRGADNAQDHSKTLSLASEAFVADDDEDEEEDAFRMMRCMATRVSIVATAITRHRWLDHVTRLVIAVNVCVMCVYHHGMDPTLLAHVDAAESFFLAIFMAEAVLRLSTAGKKVRIVHAASAKLMSEMFAIRGWKSPSSSSSKSARSSQTMETSDWLLMWDLAVLAATGVSMSVGGPNVAAPLRMVRFFFSSSKSSTRSAVEGGKGEVEKETDGSVSSKRPSAENSVASEVCAAAANAWADPASFVPPVSSMANSPSRTRTTGAVAASSAGAAALRETHCTRKDTLTQVLSSLGSLLPLAGFYALLLSAFALLGMQAYGGRWNEVEDPIMPRENFDTFPQAMLTMFTVSTGEGWTRLLYNAMRLEPWFTPVFFIIFVILVNYVLLNLVIAVVIETLELKDNEKESRQRDEVLRRTVDRELSDSGYIDMWEIVRCWVLLKLRCERWSWEQARGLSERLADREWRRLRLRRRAETATSNGSAAAMASALDLPTEDAAVAVAVAGEDVTRFIQNLSKSDQTHPPSGNHGSSNGGGGSRFTIIPVKSWTSSVLDGNGTTNCATRKRTWRLSTMRGIHLSRSGPHTDGAKKSTVAASDFDTSLFSNFQMHKLKSIAKTAAAGAESGVIARESSPSPTREEPSVGRRRNRIRQHATAQSPTSFLFADSEIPSIMPPYVSTYALGLFDEYHPFRLVCQTAVSSWWYAAISYMFIAVSLGAVLGTDPVDQVNSWQHHIDSANVAVVAFFLADMALKCAAQGFILTPLPYLSSPWNCMDAMMLAVDVAVLMKVSRWWRWVLNVLFAARPIRILNRNRSMQRLVSALAATLPSVVSVITLGAVVFLGFAVVGCRVFGGRFHSCNDSTVAFEHECVGHYAVHAPPAPGSPVRGGEIMWAERRWELPRYSFDWIGAGMLTLFEVASLDDWLDVLHSAMDATEAGRQPRENHSWAACLYFVVFIMVGSFFIIRAIIGIFIDQFGYISGAKLLTARQKLWRDIHTMAAKMSPKPLSAGPPGRSVITRFRRRCHDVVSHSHFNRIVLVGIFLNTILLATYHYGDGAVWDAAQSFGDAVFVIAFLVEAAVRGLAAHPQKHHWRDRWNVFELILAVGSAVTVLAPQGSWREQAGRPFRFSRVFRVVRYVPSLQILCGQMMLAIPSMLSIIGLMMIWVFVYAGIGTQVFPYVKYGQSLNKDANFETFPNSFLVLFQCLTGEGWRGFMHDAMIQEPECTRTDEINDCGYPNGAVVYFVTYIIAMGYVFTNLFVAAILDHVTFDTMKETELIKPTDLWDFQALWSRHDPTAVGYIGAHKVRHFVHELGDPLGAPGRGHRGHDATTSTHSRGFSGSRASWMRAVMREVTTLHVPGKGVPFDQLLETLIAVRLGPQALTVDARLKREHELREVRRWGAAVTVQAWIRGNIARTRVGGGRWKVRRKRFVCHLSSQFD